MNLFDFYTTILLCHFNENNVAFVVCSPDVQSIEYNPHKTLTRVEVIKTILSAIICIMLF